MIWPWVSSSFTFYSRKDSETEFTRYKLLTKTQYQTRQNRSRTRVFQIPISYALQAQRDWARYWMTVRRSSGFRKGCQNEDQLFRLIQTTIDGFNRSRHTTSVFIDIQQAYDKVWRKGLILKISNRAISGILLKIGSIILERKNDLHIDWWNPDAQNNSRRRIAAGISIKLHPVPDFFNDWHCTIAGSFYH